MKLADLKRLPTGTKLRLVRSLMGPCDKRRTVVRMQSNAMVVEPEDKPGTVSYLNFPKASEFEPTEKGFRVYETGGADANGRWDATLRVVAAEYVLEQA